MDENNLIQKNDTGNEVTYSPEKDFYKGARGEWRLKAEGLFKKAKEKGISIEDINIATLRENSAEFPGLGRVELPTFIAKIKGRHIATNQVILDGKQIDYYNRYQKYLAEKIEAKNILRDESGRAIRENGRFQFKQQPDLELTEWEQFEIGKALVEDKEFGLEKTITGACDRVIRKLMGENDWLQPGEAALLDEEFGEVQGRIGRERQQRRESITPTVRKASERQINFLKAKVKNAGLDPENEGTMREIVTRAGLEERALGELSTGEMSRLIDHAGAIIAQMKEGSYKQ